ncbi:MAG: hypothetical protein V4792_05205 [Pseudomonadota bacterium]
MSSSYLTLAATRKSDLYDGRWNGPRGDVLVEVKRSSNARDARDALLVLAYALADEPLSSEAICLLTKSRFTHKRLSEELDRFRFVVRPDIAMRVRLAAMDDRGELLGDLPQDGPMLRAFLTDLVHKESGSGRVSRQSVKSHLINLWLDGRGPQPLAVLQRDTGASYPTVTAALSELEDQRLLYTTRNGGAVREPSWESWRRLAEAHAAERTTMQFVDHSGLARPIVDMAKRLKTLQERSIAQSVAVGGVLGAQHYYRDLNVTAAPRLDLSVYDGDTSFLRQLDAGLVVSQEKDAKAVVVVHLNRSGDRFSGASEAGRVAPPLECLADLLEIGLSAEARDFALALNLRAKSRRSAENQE